MTWLWGIGEFRRSVFWGYVRFLIHRGPKKLVGLLTWSNDTSSWPSRPRIPAAPGADLIGNAMDEV